MKKYFFLFSSILYTYCTFNASAQTSTFSKVFYDSLQQGIQVNSIVQTPNNGYLMAGSDLYQKGLIIKMDSAGNMLWNKVFDNYNTISSGIVFNNAISTYDSGFVIVGSAQNPNTSTTNAFCTKINANGDTLWSKMYGYTWLGGAIATSVQQTNDSGYIITGHTASNTLPYTRIFVAKLNSFGMLQWSTVFTGANNNSICNAIKQTSDSGYVITGSLENYPPYSSYAFLAKLSHNGTISWAKKYNINTSEYCSGSDVMISDNGFLCYSNFGYNSTIIKTDFNGNILWNKAYNLPATSSASKIHKTYDNGYTFVNGSQCGTSTLTKIDSSGNLVWSKSLFLTAIDVLEANDKGLFVTGNGPICGVRTPLIFSPQIGIIKTDSLGNNQNCVSPSSSDTLMINPIDSSATFTVSSGLTENALHPNITSIVIANHNGCVDVSGGVNELQNDNVITVYPNPSHGIFKCTSNKLTQYKVTIYNTLGERVYQTEVHALQSEIDLTKQTKGIYYYRVLFPNGDAENGKLVIE